MKFLKLTIVALVIPTIMFAQQIKTATNELRTIEVIGAASTSLPPNVINVNFVIKEFTSNPYSQTNDMSNNMVVGGKANADGLTSKGIQIEYEVKLIFEIK
jgi:hypothetical protein